VALRTAPVGGWAGGGPGSAPEAPDLLVMGGERLGRIMPAMARAFGQFDVEITPLQPSVDQDGVSTGRNQIEKQFQGDLDGTSRGEMLTAMIPATQAAAYVAIERVNARLAGRRGTFVLQHTGTSGAAGQKLVVTVVPGSGTGQLAGIVGTMTLEGRGGNHTYTLDYGFEPTA